jgi:hypothetical protein
MLNGQAGNDAVWQLDGRLGGAAIREGRLRGDIAAYRRTVHVLDDRLAGYFALI